MLRVEPIQDRIPAETPDAETARNASRRSGVEAAARDPRTHVCNESPGAPESKTDQSLAEGIAPLLALARRGDRGSWSALYDLYAPVVHATLLVRVGHPDADDLTQEVFIAAMRRIGSLRDDAMFAPWLLSIARRRAGTLFRVRSLFRRALPRLARGRPPHAPSPAIGEPTITPLQLLEAIRSLPEAYRETLALRLIEQLQGPEIARRLGLTHGSVRVNLARGMKLLREKLAPVFPEHSP